MAPVIGITFSSKFIRGTSKNYTRAIEDHGGIACPLYPGVPDSKFSGLDGLLLTGGPDIDPIYYSEKKHETTEINANRDALELSLFKRATEENIPVFGICRGIQVMSVAMGGSLYQDIPSQFIDRLTHKIIENEDDSWHEIKIQQGSLLNQITHENAATVNSRHHQAVKVIGEGFDVTAQSRDGIIEAMEDRSKRFVLGVQYHPERMLETSEFREHRRKLFEAFIEAASH